MSLRKIFVLAVVMLLTVGLIAGCGGGEQANTENGNQEEKVYIAGVDTSFVPFEYRDEDSGEYVGFDIDMLAEIAERAGFKYELKPMDFKAIIPSLVTEKIDIAIAGMTITEERKLEVDFSIPYYDSGMLVMVSADNEDINSSEDLVGKVVGTKTGATSYNFVEGIEGVKENKPFPNITDAYMDLRQGGVEAVVHDAPNVLYYIQTNGEGAVKAVGNIEDGQQYGIGFPQGSELRDVVDAELQGMIDDGTYDQIYEKWFGSRPGA